MLDLVKNETERIDSRFLEPVEKVGSRLRSLHLRLGYTRQEAKNAELFKQDFTVEFVTKAQVENLAVNQDVVKAVQFLMNARARNEAVNLMDRGDYDGAEDVLLCALSSTREAEGCADFAGTPSVVQECASLEETAKSLKDRLHDKMSRKKLSYAAYSRRSSK